MSSFLKQFGFKLPVIVAHVHGVWVLSVPSCHLAIIGREVLAFALITRSPARLFADMSIASHRRIGSLIAAAVAPCISVFLSGGVHPRCKELSHAVH